MSEIIRKININGVDYNISPVASEEQLGMVKLGPGLDIGDDGTTVVSGKDGITNSNRGIIVDEGWLKNYLDTNFDFSATSQDNLSTYFSIVSLEDNSTVSLPTNTSPNLMYSLDGIDWTKWNYSTITLGKDDRLYLKGNNSNGFSTSSSRYNKFSITGKVELGGNMMSLLYGDDFENNNILPETYTFYNLFYKCTGIVSAEDLMLPATTLADNCYFQMFTGCTSLTTSPELPATTLADNCYFQMFNGCTSLTTSPELPATTLASSCYSYMFSGCTSLTTSPELPATTLASYCYSNMFLNCTSLTEAPELPATTLASYCYDNMFKGCTSLIEVPQLLATTLANRCYQRMFYGCTSLTEAPELPAITLTSSCYSGMFYGCTSLTTAPQLPATTLADNCYFQMFTGCTSLTAAPQLPATTLANYCYQYMFQGCTSLTEAPQLPATTLANFCYQYMFSGCKSLTTAPQLPATTLVSNCYGYMFYNCSKLNYIIMLATNISALYCLNNWVNGVASSGTFVKSSSMTSLPNGSSGIPRGWTVENV